MRLRIVVLSKHFFAKRWTKAELEGLFSLETEERKLILPLWRGVSAADVAEFSPMLAGIVAVSTDRGLEKVVHEIKLAVGVVERDRVVQQSDRMRKFDELDKNIALQSRIHTLNSSSEGVNQVRVVARWIIAEARASIEELSKRHGRFVLKLDPDFNNADRVFVQGAKGVAMSFYFNAPTNDSVEHCKLKADFFLTGDGYEKSKLLDGLEFQPWFDEALKVCWRGHGTIFTEEHKLLDDVFEMFRSVLDRVFAR